MPQRDDKEEAVFLILEEQVLGVPAGQLALQARTLGNGKHRLMVEGAGFDTELVQVSEQVLSGGGQGDTGSEKRALCPKPDPADRQPFAPPGRACQPSVFIA